MLLHTAAQSLDLRGAFSPGFEQVVSAFPGGSTEGAEPPPCSTDLPVRSERNASKQWSREKRINEQNRHLETNMI